MDLMLDSESRLMQLNELAELRDDAYENTRIYKERTKKWHDSRLRGDKDFKVGDKVLLYNSRLKMYPGKLKSKWSGPNIIKTVYPYGGVEIIDKNGCNIKVNGQRLEKYYEGDIDKEDDEVIEFENGVTTSLKKKSTKLVKYRSSGILCVDRLPQHEVDGLVEEVEELENQWAELVVELVIEMVKEMTKTRGREAAVGMTWEDFKGLMRKEFCPNNELQNLESEFWCHAMVRAGHAAYTDRFHKLARLVPHLVTPENKRIERNGSLRKNTEKRRNGGKLSRNGNVRDDNKRSGLVGRLPQSLTLLGKITRGGARMVTLLNAKNLTTTRGACFECGGTDHYKAACPRLNRAPRLGGNRQNQPMAIKGGQGHGNNGNQARGGAFMMGAEEAHQDPNIMTGTFTLNNHYATTLFHSGADYSFVSTTFIPLLDLEPSDLGFSYEIEISSGQLVEINKVIRDCKLEIEGHTFDIDLIPFGHGSFDVIIGMDWLSRHKAEIVSHEKVVRIPLPHGKILRVLEEKPQDKVKHLMSAKTKEQKLRAIVVVRNFPEVFSDDLSGLPPSQ
ncbi:putative reverse transcriptase domain-containing protein [Tanacetum coccineum]